MKKRKKRTIRWSKLIGVLFVMGSGVFFGVRWIIDQDLYYAKEQKQPIRIQELPDAYKVLFQDLKQQWPEEESIDHMIQNYRDYPLSLLELATRNSETLSFVYRYPLWKENKQRISLTNEELKQVPSLYQWDERWGYLHYGEDFMALTGCGPTSLAMVLSYLRKDPGITPSSIASYSEAHGYYVDGEGTSWNLFYDLAKQYQVKCTDVSLDEAAIYTALSKNHVLIASMGPGDFTTTGHLIVLAGIDAQGQVIVHDPNSKNRTSETWDLQTLISQMYAAWDFHN